MRVCFGRYRNGDHYATTTIPVLGGSVKLIARVTDAELRAMYQRHACAPAQTRAGISGDDIGFKISINALGRAMRAMAKPATLLKVTAMAARLAAGDATVAPEIAMQVRRGMAAKRVMSAAADGDERAIAIVARARAAARAGDGVPRVPGIDEGVMRYLLTVQRLGRQASA